MTAIATRTAAIVAVLFPFASLAQEASPSIAVTHAALGASERQNGGRPPTAILPPPSPSSQPVDVSLPTIDRAALGPVKSRSAGTEWPGGGFKLTALRARSLPATAAAQSFEYRRFGLMALGLGAAQQISARDTLTLGASYAIERRRPGFIVARRRNYRTDQRAVELHWIRDDRFDLGATLFDTGPARHRSSVERIAELAGGASRSVRGWGLTASVHPAGNPERLSVGIDFRQQQDRDFQRPDARAQIFLRQKF